MLTRRRFAMFAKPSVNLLLWALHFAERHFSVLPLIKQAGAEGVEVPLVVRAPESEFRLLRKAVHDAGLVVSSAVTVMDDKTDPSCGGNRKAALEHLQWCVNQLFLLTDGNQERLPPVLCGPLFGQLGERPTPAPMPMDMIGRRERAAIVLREAAVAASGTNIKLAVEPINRFEIVAANTLNQAADIARCAHHPQVGIMFDTHHMHTGEGRYPHRPLRQQLDRRLVVHGHISHHNRGIPGIDDQIDYLPIFEVLEQGGYQGWLAIEAFGKYGPQDLALQAATCTWHPPFEDPMDVVHGGVALIRSFID